MSVTLQECSNDVDGAVRTRMRPRAIITYIDSVERGAHMYVRMHGTGNNCMYKKIDSAVRWRAHVFISAQRSTSLRVVY